MKVLITGGAGFIGCNAAKRFLDRGDEVIVFDNLSRRGADLNLKWLRGQKGKFAFVKGDIRNNNIVSSLLNKFGRIDFVLHLAAQVAVTTSVIDPREDFEINALGTFNLLESIRASRHKPVLLNASTNKVYGGMEHTAIKKSGKRYVYAGLPYGISEKTSIAFCSPYGCSKGAAEQYVIDYARVYGLKAVNFRQSCIYGRRQFGIEDQGWVAHFIISAFLGRQLTIYGDGMQVRDILFADDLVDAFIRAYDNIDKTAGKSFNIGGGASNSISLLEFIRLLERMLGKKIPYVFKDWRPADQKVYISDTRRAQKSFKWKPKTGMEQGIAILAGWVRDNRGIFNGI